MADVRAASILKGDLLARIFSAIPFVLGALLLGLAVWLDRVLVDPGMSDYIGAVL